MNRFMQKILCCLCVALWASALSAQHFSFDYRQYKYDMTVYFTIKTQTGVAVDNLSNYEIAAFVGDECRGIGTIETKTGTNDQTLTYGYLRIYSNVSDGETVTIKYYDKSEFEEGKAKTQAIEFQSLSQLGYPSSPIVVKVGPVPPYVLGDINGDDDINTVDLALLINRILEIDDPRFIDPAGDLNGDGLYNTVDMSLLINLILNQ